VLTGTARVEITQDKTFAGQFTDNCFTLVGQAVLNCSTEYWGYDRDLMAAESGVSMGVPVSVNAAGTTLQATLPVTELGAPDAVKGKGASFALNLPVGATKFALVGMATQGTHSGTATIAYSDGTSDTFTVSFPDWVQTGSVPSGWTAFGSVSKRVENLGWEATAKKTYLFVPNTAANGLFTIPAGKTPVSFTMPDITDSNATNEAKGANIYVFAIATDLPPVADPPPVTLAQPATTQSGSTLVSADFDLGTASAGVPGDGYRASVNWGDGSRVEEVAVASDGKISGSHVYAAAGAFEAVVTVWDELTATSQTLPIAVSASVFTPSATVTDAGGNPLASPFDAEPGDTVSIAGSGFAPGEQVAVSVGGAVVVTVTADATGSIPPTTAKIPWTADGPLVLAAAGSLSGAVVSVTAVVAVPDVSALLAVLLDSPPSTAAANYTTASWAPYVAAKSAAIQVLADAGDLASSHLRQADLDSALGVLNTAIAGLVAVPSPTVTATVVAPGPTETVQVPGPVQTVVAPGAVSTVSVPGPTETVEVPGPVETVYVPTDGGTQAKVTVAKVKLPQSSLVLQVKKAFTLPIGVYFSDGSATYKVTEVSFTSSNPKVVKVSKQGKITGLKAGTATVTVTAAKLDAKGKKVSASLKVSVVKKATGKLSSVKANVPASLKVGQVVYLAASYKSAKAAGVKVTFKSSKLKVVSVDKVGTIKAMKKGKAVITVKAGKKAKKYTITVK
jgi:hypothetical protein